MFAFLRHMSSSPKPKSRPGSIRNGINLTDRSIPRGYRRPGRRPHVPSSKPTMSKSRRVSSPGSIGSGHRLYRPKRSAKRTPTCCQAALAAGAAIYGWPFEASTGFFANLLQFAVEAGRSAATAPFATTLNGVRRRRFKKSKQLRTRLFQALWI